MIRLEIHTAGHRGIANSKDQNFRIQERMQEVGAVGRLGDQDLAITQKEPATGQLNVYTALV